MKKLILLLLVIASLAACKKDENEVFLGNFLGDVTNKGYVDNELIGNESKLTAVEFTAGTNSNEIIIDGEINATVDGNGYTINEGETTYMDLSDGTAVKFEISGGGIITTNGNLILTHTYTAKSPNATVKIEQTGTLERVENEKSATLSSNISSDFLEQIKF